MGKHAKPRRFTLVRRALPSGGSDDRRVAGEAWGHELPKLGYLVEDTLEATDTGTLRRFLEAMRRQLVSEQASTPVRITPEAIRQTADYVVSSHLDDVDDAELTATVLTLHGYLSPWRTRRKAPWTAVASWSARWSPARGRSPMNAAARTGTSPNAPRPRLGTSSRCWSRKAGRGPMPGRPSVCSRPIARPTVVPYVTLWDSERPGLVSDLTLEVFPRPRLGYKGPAKRADRDERGVLVARVSSSPGKGRPIYSEMHPRRQYECARGLKCQVCREPASHNEDGWLFLDWRTDQDPKTWPERSLTAMPPLCEPHARASIEQCPHIGTSPTFAALRVRDPRPWGVAGALYRRALAGWRSFGGEPWLPYGDTRLDGMLGSKLIMELREVKPVNLRDLAAA
ncbi:hypothetical protein [Streptomyces sp. C36]|uniref:hypothetical protein n=1 Tax=Streptomyces sp. C36 TaxID=3237122 RepID=UPI0034C666BF